MKKAIKIIIAICLITFFQITKIYADLEDGGGDGGGGTIEYYNENSYDYSEPDVIASAGDNECNNSLDVDPSSGSDGSSDSTTDGGGGWSSGSNSGATNTAKKGGSATMIWTYDANGQHPQLVKISKKNPGCDPGQFSGCGISYAGSHEKVSTSKQIYNTNGKYLGGAYAIQNNIKFIAGRFIGINAYEEYLTTYYVTINPFCWESYAICRISYPCVKAVVVGLSKGGVPIIDSVIGTCVRNYRGDPFCSNGGTQIGCVGPKNCGGPSVESCMPGAISMLASKVRTTSTKPSYEGFRQDVNDIEKGIEGADKLPTIEIETYGTVDRGTPQASSYPGGAIVWQTVTTRYYYNLQKACINPKTAEVVYVRKVNSKGELDEEPCPKGYIESPELTTPTGEHIGQYYIPLNAKSTDLIKHNLTVDITKSRKTSERLCIALIEKYKKGNDKYERWRMFLADKNGRPFDATTTIQEAKRRVSGADGGCYLVYNSSFRVKQGFYNEVTENGNVYLKGYNFYYRPIDYTNPFPNGIDCDSYWCGLYKKNTNSVEVVDSKNNLTKTYLDKSFDDSTYSIYDIDLNKIRSYNAKNKYTSWDEMNLDGTSSFISGTLNGGYGITRRQCKTFYALGCGPANADWKECQDRQNRTVCD